MQQLLAILGYLPLNFKYRDGNGIGRSPEAQLKAAINPPAGHFDWRYGNTPSALQSFWKPGASGVMTQGALMAFENDHAHDPGRPRRPGGVAGADQAAIDGKGRPSATRSRRSAWPARASTCGTTARP